MSANLFAANLFAALEMAAVGIPVFPLHVSRDDSGKWTKKPASVKSSLLKRPGLAAMQ